MKLTCVCVCVCVMGGVSSREKQRLLKDPSHSPMGSASPAASDTEMDTFSRASAELHLSATEKRLTKHRYGPRPRLSARGGGGWGGCRMLSASVSAEWGGSAKLLGTLEFTPDFCEY